MKQVIVDTNVLISFVTDRNPRQQELAAKLLRSASGLQISLVCHQHVLTEFIYVLDRIYQVPKSRIRVLLSDFISMPGVEIAHEINFKQLINFWPEPISDFGDAVLAHLALAMKRTAVATFDQEFSQKLKLLNIIIFEFDL